MPPIKYVGLFIMLVAGFRVLAGGPAVAGDPEDEARLLDYQLNTIESRTLQRPGGQQKTSDLLTKQDLRITERRINTLKTRAPRNTRLPYLERQADRIRRPTRRSRR